MSVLDLDLHELAGRVRRGELSAEEVAEQSLERIREASALNAFLHVSEDAVRVRARELDARRARGETLGALAGVPIAVKDSLCTADAPTTCASKILTRDGTKESGYRPPYDATVVDRLRRADALLVGKTNQDEFAMGSSSEKWRIRPGVEPWDITRTPGGSSGGSAVSVASGLALAALGSDTGGSIRQPAAFTGTVGIKPSYGRVSRYGLVAFASSLDQVGPFARDVRSAARVLEVIAGHDPRDSTSRETPVGDYVAACDREPKGLRIGVPEDYFGPGLDAEIAVAVRAALDRLTADGCRVVPLSMPTTAHGVATYYVLATAEASSNLARFDGVRYGMRVERAGADLASLYRASRGAGFGAEVKRRILLGTYVLSAGYYDAYYRKAQAVRELVRADFARAFEEVDVIVTPTSPTPAFLLGERLDDPLAMYLADVYTLPASLAGLAALSLPVGLTEAKAGQATLPIGLQVMAPAFAEDTLVRAAAAIERSSPFAGRRPPA
ncbi:MAG: Asp-tRNA(Asn)/Glu-tRNA(Gln) amidotransferase subunit GatA [Polyangiaceae bacterium]